MAFAFPEASALERLVGVSGLYIDSSAELLNRTLSSGIALANDYDWSSFTTGKLSGYRSSAFNYSVRELERLIYSAEEKLKNFPAIMANEADAKNYNKNFEEFGKYYARISAMKAGIECFESTVKMLLELSGIEPMIDFAGKNASKELNSYFKSARKIMCY